MIIWPMRTQSRLSPDYEFSLGSSLARVDLQGAENICYLLHYHIVLSYHIILSYCIIISHYHIRFKLLQGNVMAPLA